MINLCLITIQDKPFTATEDIVCYKAITNGIAGVPQTPLMGFKLTNNMLSGKKLVKAKGAINKYKCITNPGDVQKYKIKGGVIHCYSSLEALNKELQANPTWFGYEVKIPAGTKYFIGENEHIAAKSIRFNKKI